jgi:uncharacterized protein YbaR (Trm112 family)
MSDQISKYLGKKFSCPECEAQLKFRRPPTKQLLTCPNCRRKLRLHEKAAAPSHEDLLREAIESLVAWKPPDVQPYDYSLDPRLDQVDSSIPGIWKFDQPWPDGAREIVIERTEVLYYPDDNEHTDRLRRLLLDGTFRRVSVDRTRNVEEMEITGYWWDYQPREGKLGVLARSVVRQLNRIVTAKHFAARINCLQEAIRDDEEILELFVDVAIHVPHK